MNQDSATYEATQARQKTQSQPDKIHWDGDVSFRDHPYRQLHHQGGIIGFFWVRLLEASNLKRSYWSPLALGPVKHLGLSKAHGAVSSFCSFSLDYIGSHQALKLQNTTLSNDNTELDKKLPASTYRLPSVTSPVIPASNNPVWENVQFDIPLRKGCMKSDGMRILLRVRVDEDSTSVENLIPGTPTGDARLLGMGQLDVTDLCLGQTMTGDTMPGVLDSWVPIALQPGHQKNDKGDPLAHQPNSGSENGTGMVRVLVSYQPVGLEPQAKDVVALEAFARRDLAQATCNPLLSPLKPLCVLERRGAYLLCEYGLCPTGRRKAHVRLHRNVVFVVERQNLADAAHNLALLPVDVIMSTPLGRATSQALAPVGAASKELLMPAALSLKLIWLAARTTTLASVSGIQALGATFWQEGSSSLTGSRGSTSRMSDQATEPFRHQRDAQSSTSQFVQL